MLSSWKSSSNQFDLDIDFELVDLDIDHPILKLME